MTCKEIQLLKEFKKDDDWFYANYERIQSEHLNEFIAVKDERIVAHNKDLDDLIKDLKNKEINPALTLVEFVRDKNDIVIF